MVSIEEIIPFQKQDEVAKKKLKSGKKASKGPSDAQGYFSKSKEKEKGITIKEGAFHTKQANISKDAPQSKQDGKKKVGESVEAPLATQQRTSSEGAIAMLPISTVEVTDERLVIHPYPLFRLMISFKKDALFSSKTSASLLSNLM